MAAAQPCHRDTRRGVVEALLAYGADVNARWCVSVQIGKAAEYAKAPPECTQPAGVTPLMFAASVGNSDIVSLLLKRAADRDAQDWAFKVPLDYALAVQKTDIVELLR